MEHARIDRKFLNDRLSARGRAWPSAKYQMEKLAILSRSFEAVVVDLRATRRGGCKNLRRRRASSPGQAEGGGYKLPSITDGKKFQSLLAKEASGRPCRPPACGRGRINTATDQRFGDYQTNAALVLGKQRGRKSRELAEKQSSGILNVAILRTAG